MKIGDEFSASSLDELHEVVKKASLGEGYQIRVDYPLERARERREAEDHQQITLRKCYDLLTCWGSIE